MKKVILLIQCVAHLDVVNTLHHVMALTYPVIKKFAKIREVLTLTV